MHIRPDLMNYNCNPCPCIKAHTIDREANLVVKEIAHVNDGGETLLRIASNTGRGAESRQERQRGSFRVLLCGRGQRRVVAPLLAAQFAIALCFYTVARR